MKKNVINLLTHHKYEQWRLGPLQEIKRANNEGFFDLEIMTYNCDFVML